MKYTMIPEKDFERMKNRFEQFISDISEKCCPKPINKEWLDSQEVCILLNISKRTLNSYVLREILPVSRIGNKSYFKATDIEKLIDKSKNE